MTIPPHLTQKVMEYAEIELHPQKTLWRFYFTLTLGALVTLLICPQFGVGPIGGGHGISHWVMPYGAFACGAFCAGLFVSVGTLCGVLALTRAQWNWVWRHHFFIVVPPISVLFIALMGVKLMTGVSGMHESGLFYFAWILTSVMTGSMMLKTIRILRPI
jgi:hypothetical protein